MLVLQVYLCVVVNNTNLTKAECLSQVNFSGKASHNAMLLPLI